MTIQIEFVRKVARTLLREKRNLEKAITDKTESGTLFVATKDLPEWEPYKKAKDQWMGLAGIIALEDD